MDERAGGLPHSFHENRVAITKDFLRHPGINLAATVPCDPRVRPNPPRGNPRHGRRVSIGRLSSVALVSMTVSANFGPAGCAAIDDLKGSVFQWFSTVNFMGDGEASAVAPEVTHVIPEKIPKQAAKAPKKKIKAAVRVTRSGRRPMCSSEQTTDL